MSHTIEVSPLKGSNISGTVHVPQSLKILKDGESRQKGQGVFSILTPKDGDKRVVWDSHDLDQIEDAKAMFDDLIQQGLVPYRVGLNGKATSDVMDEFDASAEEIVFLPVPAIVGG